MMNNTAMEDKVGRERSSSQEEGQQCPRNFQHNVIRSAESRKGHARRRNRSRHNKTIHVLPPSPAAFRIDPTGSIVDVISSSILSEAGEEDWQSIPNISNSTSIVYSNSPLENLQLFVDDDSSSASSTETDRDDSQELLLRINRDDDDNDNIYPDPILEGSIVDDDDDHDVEKSPTMFKDAEATSEKASICTFMKRRRCAFCVLFAGFFLIAGLIFGISIVFSKNDDANNTESPESSPTSPTVSSPSSEFFYQVGSSIGGRAVEGQFGSSLALNRDGKRLVIADLLDVFVYELKVSEVTSSLFWLSTAIIKAPPEATAGRNETYRNDVVLNAVQVDISQDSNHIVVGWPYALSEDESTPSVGCVQVFEYLGNGRWNQNGNTLYGETGYDYFGTSVSLSSTGRFVAVGSPGSDGNAAQIFELVDDNSWVKYGRINTGDGVLAVGSISMSSTGQIVAVGGYPKDGGNATSAAAVVRIFRFVAGRWIELGRGLAGRFLEGTAYVAKLSANGRIVAMSNYYIGEFSGAIDGRNDALDVRVFEWDGFEWIQLGANIHAFEPGQKSGYFISLSNDGMRIAIGDPGGNSNEAPASGDGDTGHVHAYQYNDELQFWEQNGPNHNGDSPGDQFGSAVALSGDGNYFAASAPYNSGRGQVYVFEGNDSV